MNQGSGATGNKILKIHGINYKSKFCMKFQTYKRLLSEPRMNRYLIAANYNTRKASHLYRLNLRLAQNLFSIIGYFEICLRNAIDKHYCNTYGENWLTKFGEEGGIFDNDKCHSTYKLIKSAQRKIGKPSSSSKLLASLEFRFWRYQFAQPQFSAAGKSLLKIFPYKPSSLPSVQYNSTYVFNKLACINRLRNRIAHHEPICFQYRSATISTEEVQETYLLLLTLFEWLGIAHRPLLYGLDHIESLGQEIAVLQNP